MNRRSAAWIGRVIWLLCLALFAGSALLQWVGNGRDWADIIFQGANLIFPTLGVLIVSRQPGNRIGWLFCLVGLIWIGLMGFPVDYATFPIDGEPAGLPFAPWVAWVAGWSWLPGLVILVTWLLLLFPDGRLPGPRWRPVSWLVGISLGFGILANMLAPGQITNIEFSLDNPAGIEPAASLFEALAAVVMLPIAIAAVLSAVSLIVRFRRSRGIERQQMKWFVYAAGNATAALVAAVGAYSVSEQAGDNLSAITGLALFSLPVAAGIAILRYRLYEIDRIINRTLVYVLLSASLTTVYFSSIILLGGIVRILTGQSSDLIIAISTLSVAALFRPFRSHIQSSVDRRFYRSKYDAERTLETFGATVRSAVDPDHLMDEIVSTLSTTMQAEHISVWLRSREAGR